MKGDICSRVSKVNKFSVDFLCCAASELFFAVDFPKPYNEFGSETGLNWKPVKLA